MWKKYTGNKGTLSGTLELKPGTAVFTVSNGVRGHVGIYIGGGMAEDTGKNIHALTWTGDAYHTGDVYVQGDGTTASFDGAKKVAAEEFVTEAVNAALAVLGLPIPTTADAGKILRVNAEGKYELVSP